MNNFILIAICLLAGKLFRSSSLMPRDAYKGINAWIIYIALPAVTFKYLPHIQWSSSLLLPATAPLIVWIGSWLLIKLIARKTHMSKSTQGALILASGLGNTSFAGFPILSAYYGESAISIAVICDQVTFILFSTIGVFTAIKYSGKEELKIGPIVKKLFTFPPLLGCIAAFTLPHFIDLSPIDPLVDKLAATVVPLALFSIGLQLNFKGWREEIRNLSIGLSYKLLIAPALIFAIAMAFKMKGLIPQVSVFEAGMSSHITATIMASEYNLNPKLGALMAGLGIIACLATTGIWYFALKLL